MSTITVQPSPDQDIRAFLTWRRMEKTAFPGTGQDADSQMLDYIPLSTPSDNATVLDGVPKYTKRSKLLSGENTATCTPWRRKDYTCDIIGLHEEILDFYAYMQPRDCEKVMRNSVYERVKKVVISTWPKAEVHLFGSFCTDLYLPTSDIDIVVIGEWASLPLFTLEEKLKELDYAVEGSILVLDKTAVPIIKFIDKATEIKVDISFNQVYGVPTAQLILQCMQQYPFLSPLAMIIKQFLAQRQLNEVYHGGISSYTLILMLISFFQQHPRNHALDSSANLGVLLIEFFELYGRHFNYMKVGISIVDRGCYFPKDAVVGAYEGEQGLLYVQDPINSESNAARGCYGIYQIKQAFEHAFNRLHMAVLIREKPTPAKPSLLSTIVQVSEEVNEYRSWIKSQWPSVVPSSPLPTISTISITPSTTISQSPEQNCISFIESSTIVSSSHSIQNKT